MDKRSAFLASALLAVTGVQAAGCGAASATNQQIAQENRTLRLSALCMERGSFAFFFENNSDVTIDFISIQLTLHSRKYPNQTLGKQTAQFEHVDPGAVEQDSGENSDKDCSETNFIRVRDVAVCQIKGVLFPSCRNYLQPDVIEIDGVTP